MSEKEIIPRVNVVEEYASKTGELEENKIYLRQIIELLLSNEKNVIFLQGILFGEQYGLFTQLTPNEEKRIQDPLYKRAQDRIHEMKKEVEDKLSILFQHPLIY